MCGVVCAKWRVGGLLVAVKGKLYAVIQVNAQSELHGQSAPWLLNPLNKMDSMAPLSQTPDIILLYPYEAI